MSLPRSLDLDLYLQQQSRARGSTESASCFVARVPVAGSLSHAGSQGGLSICAHEISCLRGSIRLVNQACVASSRVCEEEQDEA